MAGSSSDLSVSASPCLPQLKKPSGIFWEKLFSHSGVTVEVFHLVSLFSCGMNRRHRAILNYDSYYKSDGDIVKLIKISNTLFSHSRICAIIENHKAKSWIFHKKPVKWSESKTTNCDVGG